MSFIGKKILIRGSDNFYTNLLRATDKNKGLFVGVVYIAYGYKLAECVSR